MFNLSKMKFMFCTLVLLAVFPTLTGAVPAANASPLAVKPSNTATPTPAPIPTSGDDNSEELSTPELIEQDFANGNITAEQRFPHFSNKGDPDEI